MNIRHLLPLILVAIFYFPPAASAQIIRAHVVSTINGETLEVHDSTGKVEIVKLYGIDAPEANQAAGPEAKKMIELMSSEKTLKMERKGVDKDGKPTVTLTLNDVSLNGAMVKSGYAWVNESSCVSGQCSQWKDFQQFAQSNNKGLWKDSDPVAPWIFREHEAAQEAEKTYPTIIIDSAQYQTRTVRYPTYKRTRVAPRKVYRKRSYAKTKTRKTTPRRRRS